MIAKPRPSAPPPSCRSLHPAVLVPHLLQALVSGQVVASASAFQVLEFAAQTYGRATVERSLVQLFQVWPHAGRHWAG